MWTVPNTLWGFRWVRHEDYTLSLEFDRNYGWSDKGPTEELSQDPFDYLQYFPDLFDEVINSSHLYDDVYDEIIDEYRFRCDCGSIIEHGSIAQHFVSKKHQQYLQTHPNCQIRTVRITG
ncbi:MAG: hypothetical protein JSS09_03255 [Verrucomicrobia bacterium]|nr:hypothetical protein [Verrucomicrobiota bacterium]